MRRDPTEFRKRFARWKEGKDVYQAGRVLQYEDGKEDGEYTVYDIPYIPEKAIKLTKIAFYATRYNCYTKVNLSVMI